MAKAKAKKPDRRAKRKNKRPRPGNPATTIFRTDILAEQFADEYLKNGLDGKAAAIALGYVPANAAVAATRYLNDPRTQQRLSYLRRKISRKYELSIERITAELMKVAFTDMGDFVFRDEKGNIHFHPDALDDPDLSAAISEIHMSEQGEGAKKRRKGHIKLHDKVGALVDLGKHLGMWPKGHGRGWGEGADEDGTGGVPIEITIKGGLPVRSEKKG